MAALDPYRAAAAGPLMTWTFGDVLGVQVVERRGLLSAGAAGYHRLGARGHPHAVDVDERLVGERDAVGATDPDMLRRARRAGDILNDDARSPAAEQVVEAADIRLVDLRGVDVGRVRADVAPLLAHPGDHVHDHFFEPHRRRLELKIDRGGLPGADRYVSADHLVAEESDTQLVRASRDIGNSVLTVLSSQRPQVQARNKDLCTGDRLERGRVGDRSRDRALLLCPAGRGPAERQGQPRRENGSDAPCASEQRSEHGSPSCGFGSASPAPAAGADARDEPPPTPVSRASRTNVGRRTAWS